MTLLKKCQQRGFESIIHFFLYSSKVLDCCRAFHFFASLVWIVIIIAENLSSFGLIFLYFPISCLSIIYRRSFDLYISSSNFIFHAKCCAPCLCHLLFCQSFLIWCVCTHSPLNQIVCHHKIKRSDWMQVKPLDTMHESTEISPKQFRSLFRNCFWECAKRTVHSYIAKTDCCGLLQSSTKVDFKPATWIQHCTTSSRRACEALYCRHSVVKDVTSSTLYSISLAIETTEISFLLCKAFRKRRSRKRLSEKCQIALELIVQIPINGSHSDHEWKNRCALTHL